MSRESVGRGFEPGPRLHIVRRWFACRGRREAPRTMTTTERNSQPTRTQLVDSAISVQDVLRKRLAERKLTLTLTDKAKEAIARAGYDPVYGARPLKRAIQRQIQDPLAQQLLTGGFREGSEILVDADDSGHLTFRNAESEQPAGAAA